MRKERVDVLLVRKGLAESRSQAQRLVMAGQVRADGQVVPKPSTSLAEESELTIEAGPRFVSRGGEKLDAAILRFDVDVSGKVCADIGASTGGFTDCLLQHNASKVYAIDVGKGILHWNLRQDQRVVAMEGTNARHLNRLPGQVDIVTIDVSFISLRLLLPVIRGWFGFEISAQEEDETTVSRGAVIALIKPQFESGRYEASRGEGVIRDPEIHQRVLLEVLSFAQNVGYGVRDLMFSPLIGPKGNVEFLTHLIYPGTAKVELEAMIAETFA